MERIIVDIAKASDIYDNTEVFRKVIMRHQTTNDESNTVVLNLLVKHFILINNILTHVPLRYNDLNVTITAEEGKYIIIEGEETHIVKEKALYESEGVLKSNIELGVNTFPIMDFMTSIRQSPLMYDEFIVKIITTSANDGDFDIANFLKYL